MAEWWERHPEAGLAAPAFDPIDRMEKPVLQLDARTGQIVGRFDSLTQAAGRVQTWGLGCCEEEEEDRFNERL